MSSPEPPTFTPADDSRGGPRRYLIATAISRYPKAPPELGWDRPGLVQAREKVIKLFTGQLGYQHVSTLGLDPTREQLTSQLRTFCKAPERREGDLIAVYIAGHGDVLDDSGEHVLLTADVDPDDIEVALPTAELAKQMLRKTRVRRLLLMLDTCHSGAGTNQMAARMLAELGPTWRQQPGAGIVVISSSQPSERAKTLAFTHLLEQAVASWAVAGHGPAELAIDAVVQRMNTHPDRPGYQLIGLDQVGLSGDLPDFLRNPRHDVRLTEVDLAIQQAAEWDALAERRAIEYRTRLLVRAMAGAGPGDGWWFSGRFQAIEDITIWLRTGRHPGRGRARDRQERQRPGVLAVTAGPGSGKTAVLGLIATLTHPERRQRVPLDSIGLDRRILPQAGDVAEVIYAQNLSDKQVLDGIAAVFKIRAASVRQFLNALADSDHRPASAATLIIDAVDEAETPDTLCRDVLRPLIDLAGSRLRLLLGTRPHLLARLGLKREDEIDLDADRYADLDALRTYTMRNLMESRSDSPYWDCDPQVRIRIAHQVAASAGFSFLVARITAGTLAAAQELPDPDDAAWRAGLPRMPAEAIRQDLTNRLKGDAERAIDLLRPLAFADGQGLPWEDLWPAVASAVSGRTYTDDDLDWLRRTAGSYVVEATEAGRSAYRLYHQAMAETLCHDVDETAVHTGFTRALIGRVPYTVHGERDWARAHPYTRTYLASHAALAGLLDNLVTDTEYLVHANPDTLLPHLDTIHTPDGKQATTIYRASIGTHRHATPETRRQILALDAARYNIPTLLTAFNATAEPHAWKPVMATGTNLSRPARNTMTGHTGSVNTVACTTLGGRPIAVTGSDDGTVRIWDLTTGNQIDQPLTGHNGSVWALACTTLDGRPVAITGSHDTTVRIWDLATNQQIGQPLTGHNGSVWALACTTLDGRPVAITGSDDGMVRIWDLTTGHQIGNLLTGHTGPVTALACTTLDGRPIAITGSHDTTVRIWDLTTGNQIGQPLTGHIKPVFTAACTTLDGRPIAVAGSDDGTVRIWDLATGNQISKPLTGHTDVVLAVAGTTLEGRPIAVTGSADGTVWIWDVRTRQQICDPLTGHTGEVYAVACTTLEGRPVAVTGSADGTVRIWDLTTGSQIGQPLTGHTGPVWAVACTTLESRLVAVAGSDGGTVRIWDLTTRHELGDPLTGHTGSVIALACTTLDGRPIAVTGSDDDMVRIWDLTTGNQIGQPLTGHTGPVWAAACTTLDGRPIAVTGSHDRTVRIWDLSTGHQVGDPLTGHTDTVWAAACTTLDGRPVAITGSDDTTVRIWDLPTHRLTHVINLPGMCNGVAFEEIGLLLCSFGSDLAVYDR
ncbi:caspase family protein [Nonomuraea sp. H19]|uniref:caspase family protein n=1 Tax=Nonomuraea sp. H19 TaxID=3452206 RepID=UPI003F8A1816